MTLADLIAQVLLEFITIDEQREVLGDILSPLPGLKTVFKRRPDGLADSELPALLLVPGNARHDRDLHAESLRVQRDWSLLIAVKKQGQGREFEGEELAEPFVDRLAIAVALFPIVYLSDGRGFEMRPTADAFIKPLPWAKDVYFAVEQRIVTIVEATTPRLIWSAET